MTESNTISNNINFKDFIFRNHRNRTLLILAAIAMIIQFAIFKYLYPFASYIHGDSFSYINAADKNLSINTYLVGYSNFLRLFSIFSKSDLALTAFQYLFIQCSMHFLLFTIFYIYKPGKIVQIILLCFMVFNPLFLHLANLISSDGYFLGLSLVWFTLLIWIIHHPSKRVIIWHAFVLAIAFTVRYNAMLYPFISIIAFSLSKLPVKQKLIGFGAGLALCGMFVLYTSYHYKTLTGYWQYSPFSGWQLANNSMYAYRFVDSSERKPVQVRFQVLDNMIRTYFDSTRDTKIHPQEALMASSVYMWSKGLPLYKYRDNYFAKWDTTTTEFKKWASIGPFFKDYGIYMIRKYPQHFLRYFVWPNAIKYYSPPVEFLSSYNSDRRNVPLQTKIWFNYKSQNVYTRMKNNNVWILTIYPVLSGTANVIMLFMLIFYLLLKGWKKNQAFKKGICIGSTIWLLNAGFTIFASTAALRFQSFPLFLTITFVLLLIDWYIRTYAINSEIENTYKEMAHNPEMARVF